MFFIQKHNFYSKSIKESVKHRLVSKHKCLLNIDAMV